MSPVVYNFNCYNFPGESDDDREELFVAANAARNARSMALDFIYLFISNFRSSPERHHFCFSFFFFFFFFYSNITFLFLVSLYSLNYLIMKKFNENYIGRLHFAIILNVRELIA
jgi:hypothetical protein